MSVKLLVKLLLLYKCHHWQFVDKWCDISASVSFLKGFLPLIQDNISVWLTDWTHMVMKESLAFHLCLSFLSRHLNQSCAIIGRRLFQLWLNVVQLNNKTRKDNLFVFILKHRNQNMFLIAKPWLWHVTMCSFFVWIPDHVVASGVTWYSSITLVAKRGCFWPPASWRGNHFLSACAADRFIKALLIISRWLPHLLCLCHWLFFLWFGKTANV